MAQGSLFGFHGYGRVFVFYLAERVGCCLVVLEWLFWLCWWCCIFGGDKC